MSWTNWNAENENSDWLFIHNERLYESVEDDMLKGPWKLPALM